MKNNVFWFPQGRLGNQIFQYQAIKSLEADSRIFTIESEICNTFEMKQSFKIFRVPRLIRAQLIAYLFNIFRFLARKGFIGHIFPDHSMLKGFDVELKKVNKIPGAFRKFWFIEGWFQYPDFIDPRPQVKKSLLSDVEAMLINIPKFTRVAVHLRFGDFRDWSILGVKDVSLPISYYLEAFNQISRTLDDPVFIIFSDDIGMAKKAFKELPYNFHFFSTGSSVIDFVAISLCSHGVSSASTFSWWAMNLIQDPQKNIIAPKYWQGFKSDEWYPVDIKTNSFCYLEVFR